MILGFEDLTVNGGAIFAKGKNLSSTILNNESSDICTKLPYRDSKYSFNPSAGEMYDVFIRSTSIALADSEGIQLKMLVSAFNVDAQSFDDSSRVSLTLIEDCVESTYSEIELSWFEESYKELREVSKDLKVGKTLYVTITPSKKAKD